MKHINEALRLIRVYHDISGVELAKHIHTSPGYLSEIENGEKTAGIKFITAHAKFFYIDLPRFFSFAESLRDFAFVEKEDVVRKCKKMTLFSEHILGMIKY